MTEKEWNDRGKEVSRLRKINYNRLSLMEKIYKLVDSTPNDQELGAQIRKLINENSI